ncbi:bifunctional heptose 7-phosphate kinase/heptose 1-phosphate adenyltransferase, partial [bacterium]
MFRDVLAVKAALLHEFPRRRVLVVGDLMLDRYLWGSATRISPEAPVPVVRVERRSVALGGAANVARNLASLGVPVQMAGYVGHDADAEILRAEFERQGIGADAVVAIERFCTIVKSRIIADDRQVLRFDDEVTSPRSAADSDLLLQGIEAVLAEGGTSAVILSDYAKGLCTPYFCAGLMHACWEQGVPVYVDPKGRDYGKYAGATAIKPNRPEIAELAAAMGWPTAPLEAAARLREELGLEFVAQTLGAQGIALVTADGVHSLPTVAREVY